MFKKIIYYKYQLNDYTINYILKLFIYILNEKLFCAFHKLKC